MAGAKYVVVNADDFGASRGVNRGICESHTKGIVTSTSMMVTGSAANEAVRMAADVPDLGIGLHFDICGEDERPFDLYDLKTMEQELRGQLALFTDLMGRMPTHVDSHRHVHRHSFVRPLFRELLEPLDIPLRDDGRVRFLGDFYAQWEWGVTDLEKVSVPFLQALLTEKVVAGWTEVSCHPGFQSDDYAAMYGPERESELATLTDIRVRETVEALGIELVSFSAFGQVNR
jgi:predicted glycoside hydrolase/deacetylase ChbG (UPF0249 family)